MGWFADAVGITSKDKDKKKEKRSDEAEDLHLAAQDNRYDEQPEQDNHDVLHASQDSYEDQYESSEPPPMYGNHNEDQIYVTRPNTGATRASRPSTTVKQAEIAPDRPKTSGGNARLPSARVVSAKPVNMTEVTPVTEMSEPTRPKTGLRLVTARPYIPEPEDHDVRNFTENSVQF